MTKNKKLNKAVRARMDRTGESFSTARMQILAKLGGGGNDGPPPHPGWHRGPVMIDGTPHQGWVREADRLGVVLWSGGHPFGWPEYAHEGWVKVSDGRIVETFFPKLASGRRADPDDPPLWAMGPPPETDRMITEAFQDWWDHREGCSRCSAPASAVMCVEGSTLAVVAFESVMNLQGERARRAAKMVESIHFRSPCRKCGHHFVHHQLSPRFPCAYPVRHDGHDLGGGDTSACDCDGYLPRDSMLVGRTSWWSAVLAEGRGNPRLDIIAAVPDALERLERLRADLTVEEVVGLANALFNACDPKDLREAAPDDIRKQGELAWGYLDDAKWQPRLGGRWAKTVTALRPGGDLGLRELAELGLEPFMTAVFRVVSQVYRKM